MEINKKTRVKCEKKSDIFRMFMCVLCLNNSVLFESVTIAIE